MDKAEIEALGAVAGGGEGENPLETVCTGCHGEESDEVSCNDNEWKSHLIQGRVAAQVWSKVSMDLTNSTCGW
jgi:cytochrome c5